MEKQTNNKLTFRTCPECGKNYIGAPALSRVDNCTPICPECGSRQALKAMGIKDKEIDEIIDVMREAENRTMN